MLSTLSRTSLLLLASVGLAQSARAQTLTLDDFSTGPLPPVSLVGGTSTTFQTGTGIYLGNRQTTFIVAANPFAQRGTVTVAGGLLVVNADAGVWAGVDLYYGQAPKGAAPLGLDLTAYDRFRISFRHNAQTLSLNILVFTTGVAGYRQLSTNVSTRYDAFTMDFPFTDFVVGGAGSDWAQIDAILVVLSSWPLGSGDFVVDGLEIRGPA